MTPLTLTISVPIDTTPWLTAERPPLPPVAPTANASPWLEPMESRHPSPVALPEPPQPPLFQPTAWQSLTKKQRNEILAVTQTAFIYSGPPQAAEVKGLIDQRIDSPDVDANAFFNPDGDFARWEGFGSYDVSQTWQALAALNNELMSAMGGTYYDWIGHDRDDILASPELKTHFDQMGDLEISAANFTKIIGQLWLAKKTKGQSGLESYLSSALKTAQVLLNALGIQKPDAWLDFYDALATRVCSTKELQQRRTWRDIFSRSASPSERAQALFWLTLSNAGIGMASVLDRLQAVCQGLASEPGFLDRSEIENRERLTERWLSDTDPTAKLKAFIELQYSNAAIAVRYLAHKEKARWHALKNDNLEDVFNDALATQFLLSATEKAMAWWIGFQAGSDNHALAFPVAVARQAVYAYMVYRWVPPLTRKTWNLIFSGPAYDAGMSREYLLQISLFTGKALLALYSIGCVADMGARFLISGDAVSLKAFYDVAVQAARESPPWLNYPISAAAVLLTGAGLMLQARDLGTVFKRVVTGQTAPANEFNLGNGAQFGMSLLGLGAALCNCLAMTYLGSYSNAPLFMFWTGVGKGFGVGQTLIKYKDYLLQGARNLRTKLTGQMTMA